MSGGDIHECMRVLLLEGFKRQCLQAGASMLPVTTPENRRKIPQCEGTPCRTWPLRSIVIVTPLLFDSTPSRKDELLGPTVTSGLRS